MVMIKEEDCRIKIFSTVNFLRIKKIERENKKRYKKLIIKEYSILLKELKIEF